jgi:agarase
LYQKGIAYTPVIDMAASVQRDLWLKGGLVDYFSPQFRDVVERVAARACAPHAGDPWLLGYFTDNELRWGKDWRSQDSLLDSYLRMPSASAGLARASAFVKALGHEATDEDRLTFAGLVAAEYARVTTQAIHRHDPNHLVLGCRFAAYPGDAAIVAVGLYFDVISLHSYAPTAPIDRLRQITQLTGKPTMVTEFSFKAMDSGLPNTKGAGKPVATQSDRANAFTNYVESLAALPGAVGYHWFEYRDEPKEGRFDGENSNHGVVKIDFYVSAGIECPHFRRFCSQNESRDGSACTVGTH